MESGIQTDCLKGLCKKCGLEDTLDKFATSYKSKNGKKASLLKVELDKCLLLCSNCHRIHHYKEGTLGEIKSNRKAQKLKVGDFSSK